MAWVRLIATSKLRLGGGTFVTCADREFAVFQLDETGEIVVLDNACPHANGNLSGGVVAEGVVTCPWHEWRFDLRTGVCTNSDRARVTRYPVEVRDGHVWIQLD